MRSLCARRDEQKGASHTKPEALTFIEIYEAGAKTARIAGPPVLLPIGGLIFWLVRRRRAKRAAPPT